jgi:MFS family permease
MDLRLRPYHRFMVGMLLDRLGFQVQSVAVAWHVFTLHHAPLDLGFVGLALFLPNLLFFLPAGVIADRIERHTIWRLTELMEALGICCLILFVVRHVTVLWPYLLVLFLIGGCWTVGAPAARSMLPNLLPRELLVSGQARYASLRSLILFVGPALGGVLVAVGVVQAMAFAICMLVLSSFTIGALRATRQTAEARPRPGFRECLEGFAFIRSQPLIAAALSLDLFAVFFGDAMALLPAYADGIFHIGPTGLGLLRCAPAAGAALTAAYLSRRPPRYNVGITLIGTVSLFGCATILFGLSKSLPLSLLALAITGGSDMVSVVIRNALVQLTTPDHMRGRVSAFENIFIGASNELGECESSTLAAGIGVVPAVVTGGLATLAIIAIWSRLFPVLLETHDLEKLCSS